MLYEKLIKQTLGQLSWENNYTNFWLWVDNKHEGEKNTRRGGWIVLAFSSFSPTEVTDQKQIEFSFWSDNQNLNASDKNREREREREKAIIQVPSKNRK